MCAVDNWGVMFGVGLLATVVGVIAFVRYRQQEVVGLRRQTELARELRDLAGADEVRLAAVDEFSLAIYQRLFYASVVAPWIRSAAWSLLGAVLAAAGALLVGPLDGVFATITHIAMITLATIFGLATLVFAGVALFHTATTPRVSFRDSYADAELEDNTAGTPTKAETPATTESAAEAKA